MFLIMCRVIHISLLVWKISIFIAPKFYYKEMLNSDSNRIYKL